MPDSQHEYYIRSASEDEARGPFTIDQLARLASAGQLARDTLYYAAEREQWVPFGENGPLSAELFSGAEPPVAPAGTSPGGSSPSLPRRAVCAGLLLAGALALAPPFLFAGGEAGISKIITHPFALLGAIDLVLALAAGAAGISAMLAKIIRLRAALGLGFMGALFWLQAQPEALVVAVPATAGLWFATFAATRRGLALAATAGLAGVVSLAYFLAS